MSDVIQHKGIVKRVEGAKVLVSIISQSACSSCHANGACSVADIQEKEIEIISGSQNFKVGQQVNVLMKESAGFKAVFLGYIMPLIVLLFVLIGVFSVSKNQNLAGLLSLISLIPYYITLYFLRNHLKKIFKFEIEEID
jgi:sigma-E factor negative regulatory protein RseC